jgi:hypothetical protein
MKPKPGGDGRMNYGGRTYPEKLGTGDSMRIRDKSVDPDSLNPDPDPAFHVNPDSDTNPRF